MIAYTKDKGKTWNDDVDINELYKDLIESTNRNGTTFKLRPLTQNCTAMDIDNVYVTTTIYGGGMRKANVVLDKEMGVMTVSSGGAIISLVL